MSLIRRGVRPIIVPAMPGFDSLEKYRYFLAKAYFHADKAAWAAMPPLRRKSLSPRDIAYEFDGICEAPK